MSLCGDKSCVPCAIKIQNYARQTEVEEIHTLPEMITTEARSVFRCASVSWIHVGESVTQWVMFLRFGQILGILQTFFRHCSEYVLVWGYRTLPRQGQIGACAVHMLSSPWSNAWPWRRSFLVSGLLDSAPPPLHGSGSSLSAMQIYRYWNMLL